MKYLYYQIIVDFVNKYFDLIDFSIIK